MAGGDAGVEVAGGTEEEGEWHDIADTRSYACVGGGSGLGERGRWRGAVMLHGVRRGVAIKATPAIVSKSDPVNVKWRCLYFVGTSKFVQLHQ